jgi:hypothetical protein
MGLLLAFQFVDDRVERVEARGPERPVPLDPRAPIAANEASSREW